MTNIKSLSDLNIDIVKNLDKIAKIDFDIIVGIPRSGLLVATLLSTHLQKDVTDIYSFMEGNVFSKSGKLIKTNINECKILLVDDSIHTGNSMSQAVEMLKKSNPKQIIKFAVYKSQKTNAQDVDFYVEEVLVPRVFQWNLWKHVKAKNWATDLDGVLCRDPIWMKENDKGPRLVEFYKTADQKFPLHTRIGYIITSRLEKHRAVTEEWLTNNNINYGALIMKPNDLDLEHAEYKIEVLKTLPKVDLYIESDVKQAKRIAKKVDIPIWCIDSQQVFK